MLSRHPLREGVIAGTLGAAAIAVVTLVADGLTDRLGVTPALLGAALLDLLGGGFGGRGFTTHVLVWLFALFAVVIAVGVATSYVYNATERKPSFVAGLIGMVLVLEVVLLTITALAARSELFGVRAWVYGLLGNILGGLVMGRYLWRQHHPEAAWDWEHENEAHFHPDHAPPHAGAKP
jgi:MFS family permease